VRRFLSPKWLAALGLILLALVAGAVLLTPTDGSYIFLPDDAHPLEPLIEVEGEKPDRDGNTVFFVDVIVRKATLVERLFPSLHDGSRIVPAHAVNPAGVSDEVRRRGNRREMSRSQQIAAAVALRELGYKVDARPTGALVSQVIPDTPAARALEPGDIVVGVGDKSVRTPEDLQRLVAGRPPGTTLDLRLRRDRDVKDVQLRTVRDPTGTRRSVIGVAVEQAADIELPIDVEIDVGDVGGPSAGLAFALAIMEKLGRDVDHGRKVAVTGELELDGDVREIGGVEQKTIGAKRTGVDAFVVPGDNAEEARRYADGLRIIPVRTFQQALRALATAGAAE
jgi:PDZ domain-containing protein